MTQPFTLKGGVAAFAATIAFHDLPKSNWWQVLFPSVNEQGLLPPVEVDDSVDQDFAKGAVDADAVISFSEVLNDLALGYLIIVAFFVGVAMWIAWTVYERAFRATPVSNSNECASEAHTMASKQQAANLQGEQQNVAGRTLVNPDEDMSYLVQFHDEAELGCEANRDGRNIPELWDGSQISREAHRIMPQDVDVYEGSDSLQAYAVEFDATRTYIEHTEHPAAGQEDATVSARQGNSNGETGEKSGCDHDDPEVFVARGSLEDVMVEVKHFDGPDTTSIEYYTGNGKCNEGRNAYGNMYTIINGMNAEDTISRDVELMGVTSSSENISKPHMGSDLLQSSDGDASVSNPIGSGVTSSVGTVPAACSESGSENAGFGMVRTSCGDVLGLCTSVLLPDMCGQSKEEEEVESCDNQQLCHSALPLVIPRGKTFAPSFLGEIKLPCTNMAQVEGSVRECVPGWSAQEFHMNSMLPLWRLIMACVQKNDPRFGSFAKCLSGHDVLHSPHTDQNNVQVLGFELEPVLVDHSVLSRGLVQTTSSPDPGHAQCVCGYMGFCGMCVNGCPSGTLGGEALVNQETLLTSSLHDVHRPLVWKAVSDCNQCISEAHTMMPMQHIASLHWNEQREQQTVAGMLVDMDEEMQQFHDEAKLRCEANRDGGNIPDMWDESHVGQASLRVMPHDADVPEGSEFLEARAVEFDATQTYVECTEHLAAGREISNREAGEHNDSDDFGDVDESVASCKELGNLDFAQMFADHDHVEETDVEFDATQTCVERTEHLATGHEDSNGEAGEHDDYHDDFRDVDHSVTSCKELGNVDFAQMPVDHDHVEETDVDFDATRTYVERTDHPAAGKEDSNQEAGEQSDHGDDFDDVDDSVASWKELRTVIGDMIDADSVQMHVDHDHVQEMGCDQHATASILVTSPKHDTETDSPSMALGVFPGDPV